MIKIKFLVLVLLLGFGVCTPVAATRNSPPLPFNEEQVAEGLQAEAQLLVEGFIAEFPNTLEAMPDNPYHDRMDRLERLLVDRRFQDDMVGIAREILSQSDIATILQARYQGLRNKKYFKEMMRVSLVFADAVTPMILEKLESPTPILS